MKKIAAVVLSVFFFGTVCNAQELCTCTDSLYDFTTANPDDVEYMEDFLWEVQSCTGSTVIVKLVGEDSPIFDMYTEDEDGNQKLFYDGQWVRFDKFKPQCSNIPTS